MMLTIASCCNVCATAFRFHVPQMLFQSRPDGLVRWRAFTERGGGVTQINKQLARDQLLVETICL